MTVDVVAVLDRLRAQVVGPSAVKGDLMIGAQPFDDGIEALTRPGQQLTKPMDRDRGAIFTEALIGRPELPAEGLRLDEPGALLLVVKPATHSKMTPRS